MNPASDLELAITRVFNASRRRVSDAWTQEAQLSQWCLPKGFTAVDARSDIRPGGAWHCQMRAPDGSEHRASGVYREVVPEDRVVFTHAWDDEKGQRGPETTVTVRFSDENEGKTRLDFEQGTFSSVGSRDGHRGGWTETLDALDDYLGRQASR